MMMFLKKLHKWVGLLIGIQVLLWLVSGLVISLLDPSKVSGKQWAQPPVKTQPLQFENILEVQDLPTGALKNALSIDLRVFRKQPVYQVRHPDSVTLINAVTGLSVQFSEDNAKTLAQDDFDGSGEVVSITKGTAPDMETRNHAGPYWRVDFSDQAQSSYYVSAWNGDILERRNKYWRTHDFFWMLHIMDYQDHEDINNFLVIGVALIAVWLGISGFILLFGSFGRHDFWFLNITGQRKQRVVTLIDPVSSQPREIKLRKGGNLFLTLANHGIELPSKCGGGGECGKCRVRLAGTDLAEPNMIERKLLANSLLDRGFRLACQQALTDHVTLHVPEGTLSNSGKRDI
jgi:Na+-transporting NADH:ubiquinone oxidoreductase subunit F